MANEGATLPMQETRVQSGKGWIKARHLPDLGAAESALSHLAK
jgi:hypothetical protein